MSIINQINTNPAISTAAKRVFSFMVDTYQENLKKSRNAGRKDCITILKYVLVKAYEMAGFFASLPMRGEKITDDIRALKSHGFCNQVNFYYPVTFKKKVTLGYQKPRIFQTLRFDDFARVGTVTDSRPFITAKILSLMDGYHAVLILAVNWDQVIFLDNNEVVIFDNIDGTGIPNDVFPTDKLNAKINKYVSEKWCKVHGDTGTKYKTETILATLNLFDWLV